MFALGAVALAATVMSLSAMGLSLNHQCEGCNSSTAVQLRKTFLALTVISAVVLVAVIAWEWKKAG